jgi:hypothetical protein
MSNSTLVVDYLGRGTFAARPASLLIPAGAIGFYYATDTAVLYLWSGAWSKVYEDINPFSDGGITKPLAANFTITTDSNANHGTGSAVDLATRGVEFSQIHGTGGATQSLYTEAAVANTLNTMIAYLEPNFDDLASSGWGYYIGVRDNAGKIHAFGVQGGSPTAFSEARYTDINTLSSITPQTGGNIVGGRPIWLQLQNTGGNFVFSASFNGETYFTVETVSALAWVGATLNDIGLFIVNNLAVSGAVINLDCFSFTRT